MVKKISNNKSKSEGKYKALFMASRDAVMTLEPPSWKFTSGNPAAIKMFKVKNEAEFLSYEPWKLSPTIQPDGQLSAEKAKKMIEEALKEGINFFEWRHKRINGEEFLVEVLLSRVQQGNKVFLYASVRDITERKKAQEDLEKFNKIMIDRELKMEELQKELAELKNKIKNQN
ncbi:MAG: PAS domain S-box protein [Parcubacteria group bacterium]